VFHFDVLLLKAPNELVVLNLRCSIANGSVVEQISTLPHQNKFYSFQDDKYVSNLFGGLYLIIVSVVVIT
jgi:hypothetical protein